VSHDEYLAEVEGCLTDLPWRARKRLVADLRVHLGEIPAGENLVARLGSPQSFAAELRGAAGLPPRRGPVAFLRARRPRNLVIALVVLAVAASIGVGVAWARSYQPLTSGSTSLGPIPSHQGAVGETIAAYRDGKPFQIGFSVRNDGRFAIRIVSIPVDGLAGPFTARAYVVPSETDDAARAVPFRPFTLEPHHERLIVLRGTYNHCHSFVSGGSITILSLPIRAQFALWTRTVSIALADPLEIRMPAHRNPCSTG
jgi:hypothetical protein